MIPGFLFALTPGLPLALTPELPLGPQPCNPFALVVSPKLELRHHFKNPLQVHNLFRIHPIFLMMIPIKVYDNMNK